MSLRRPKTLLTWREPGVLVRWRIEEELRSWTLRSRLLYVLLVPLVLLPPLLISWELDKTRACPPEVAVPGAFLFGIALVYGAPHLRRFFPSYLRIMEHAIVKTNYGTSWWPYERIAKCSFGTLEIGDQRVRVMTIAVAGGNDVVFGIDDHVSRERLRELLREKGITPS